MSQCCGLSDRPGCSVVLRRTVVGVDWRFDNLSGSHHQSDEGFRSGCRNVSQHQQQSFSGLHNKPGRSLKPQHCLCYARRCLNFLKSSREDLNFRIKNKNNNWTAHLTDNFKHKRWSQNRGVFNWVQNSVPGSLPSNNMACRRRSSRTREKEIKRTCEKTLSLGKNLPLQAITCTDSETPLDFYRLKETGHIKSL